MENRVVADVRKLRMKCSKLLGKKKLCTEETHFAVCKFCNYNKLLIRGLSFLHIKENYKVEVSVSLNK